MDKIAPGKEAFYNTLPPLGTPLRPDPSPN